MDEKHPLGVSTLTETKVANPNDRSDHSDEPVSESRRKFLAPWGRETLHEG